MACRLCYTVSEDFIEIFSEEKISKYIKKFLDLEVNKDDQVSKVICAICWHQIKIFQSFYMRIHEVQRRPQLKLKKESSLNEKELTEMEESGFEYVNTEADADLHENSEIMTAVEEELPERINPECNDTKVMTVHPNVIRRKARHYKKLSKTTRSFKNEQERKHFVQLMKKEEIIWNRTHKHNTNSGALIDAWKRVSSSMLTPKSVNECKVMWKSLRDALRYEKRKAALGIDQGNDLRNLLSFVSSTSTSPQQKKSRIATRLQNELETNDSIDNSQPETSIIQNYHTFDNATAAWSERTCEGSDVSAYSEKPSKHIPIPNNVEFDTNAEKHAYTTRAFHIGSTTITSTNVNHMNDTPPPVQFKPTPSFCYGDVKTDFKHEVTDLVESISKALNRLVTIATTQVQQVKPSHVEFKYEYIWKLIECLYLQMDLSAINDLNQRIINMVYESCKTNVNMLEM